MRQRMHPVVSRVDRCVDFASYTKALGCTCWALSWGGLRQIREMSPSFQSPSHWPVTEMAIMNAYADHADHCITHLVLAFTACSHFLHAPLDMTVRRGGCQLSSITRTYGIYSVDAVVVFDSSVASTSCHYTVALGSSENGQSMYPWGSSGTYHKSRVARTIGRSFARRKGKSGWNHSSSAS